VAIGLNAQVVQEQFLWGIFQNEKAIPYICCACQVKNA
jgi:hypothetical protein